MFKGVFEVRKEVIRYLYKHGYYRDKFGHVIITKLAKMASLKDFDSQYFTKDEWKLVEADFETIKQEIEYVVKSSKEKPVYSTPDPNLEIKV